METLSLTPKQLAELKEAIKPLYLMAQALADRRDNNGLQIIATELQNAAHNSEGCVNHNHDRSCEDMCAIEKVLDAINNYENNYYSKYFLDEYTMLLFAHSQSASEEEMDRVVADFDERFDIQN